MKPEIQVLADLAHFKEVVKGATICGSQCCNHKKRYEAIGLVFLHSFGQGGTSERKVLVRIQKPHDDITQKPSPFN